MSAAIPQPAEHLNDGEQNFCCVTLGGERLELHPQRAAWWANRKTLFIADTHFGKEATFRAAAIPIPDQTAADLERLSKLLHRTHAKRLVILGDLIHSRRGRCEQTFELITQWRNQHDDLAIDLIRGNHDDSAGDPPIAWRMECRSEPVDELPFALCHRPTPIEERIVLAGHLHPTIRLTGAGRDSLKLACFLLRSDVLTLPAFSSFVDGASIRRQKGDQVFAVCEERVIKLPSVAQQDSQDL